MDDRINLVTVECRMGEPPNPPELAQAIAAMLTGRDEQTALLREIAQQGRVPQPEQHHPPPIPGYEQFLGTELLGDVTRRRQQRPVNPAIF